MKNLKYFLNSLFAFSLLFTMVNGMAKAEITNFNTPKNLKSNYDLGCITSTQIKAKYTPADLSDALYECVIADRFADARLLYIMTITFGAYDGLRVSDKSAPQAINVLLINFSQRLKEKSPTKLQEFISYDTVEKAKHPSGLSPDLCQVIRQIGKPNYRPVYMIEHGIEAYMKPESDGMKDDYNGDEIWERVLSTSLRC